MQSLIDLRSFDRFTGVAACGNTVLVISCPRRVLRDGR